MKIVFLTRENNVSTFLISNLIDQGIEINAVVYEQARPKNLSLLVRKMKNAFKKSVYSLIDLLLAIPFVIIEMRLVEKHFAKKITPFELPRHNFDDISDANVVEIISQYKPDLIMVFGTSIIKGEILLLDTDIINIHMGKTTLYRGTKNEFWAMLHNDFENIGATLHTLDAGIDTGRPLHFIRLFVEKIKPFYKIRIENIENLVKELPPFLNAYQFNDTSDQVADHPKGRLYTTPTFSSRFKYFVKMLSSSL
ncbi:formyltransferase family protein [bacterium]|nr:formyltransferase family protein [bacterium]